MIDVFPYIKSDMIFKNRGVFFWTLSGQASYKIASLRLLEYVITCFGRVEGIKDI